MVTRKLGALLDYPAPEAVRVSAGEILQLAYLQILEVVHLDRVRAERGLGGGSVTPGPTGGAPCQPGAVALLGLRQAGAA